MYGLCNDNARAAIEDYGWGLAYQATSDRCLLLHTYVYKRLEYELYAAYDIQNKCLVFEDATASVICCPHAHLSCRLNFEVFIVCSVIK